MTKEEQKKFEENLKHQALEKNSKLNIELQELKETIQIDTLRADRFNDKIKELQKTRDLLDKKIANIEIDQNHLNKKIRVNSNIRNGYINARKDAVRLIKKYKFNFCLNDEVPYVDSEHTQNLEDQEVFLDTWVDVRNRVNDLVTELEEKEVD